MRNKITRTILHLKRSDNRHPEIFLYLQIYQKSMSVHSLALFFFGIFGKYRLVPVMIVAGLQHKL